MGRSAEDDRAGGVAATTAGIEHRQTRGGTSGRDARSAGGSVALRHAQCAPSSPRGGTAALPLRRVHADAHRAASLRRYLAHSSRRSTLDLSAELEVALSASKGEPGASSACGSNSRCDAPRRRSGRTERVEVRWPESRPPRPLVPPRVYSDDRCRRSPCFRPAPTSARSPRATTARTSGAAPSELIRDILHVLDPLDALHMKRPQALAVCPHVLHPLHALHVKQQAFVSLAAAIRCARSF